MKRLLQALSKKIYPNDIVVDHHRRFQYEVSKVTVDAVTVGAMRKYPHVTIGMLKSCVTKSRCLTFKREVVRIYKVLNENPIFVEIMTNGRKYNGE